MTKINTSNSTISHAFQSLAAELDLISEGDHAAYLARVAIILAHELNNQSHFETVLQRAKGGA